MTWTFLLTNQQRAQPSADACVYKAKGTRPSAQSKVADPAVEVTVYAKHARIERATPVAGSQFAEANLQPVRGARRNLWLLE